MTGKVPLGKGVSTSAVCEDAQPVTNFVGDNQPAHEYRVENT
jgi:hypothetical protein